MEGNEDASGQLTTQQQANAASDPVEEELGAQFAGLGGEAHGFVTRQRIANVADKLFGALASKPAAAKIGRFTIVRELGAGGMGVVYICYDEQLDRSVAVKLLRGANADELARARFEREAQAMARLSHPNVVTVHEVGTHEGELYVAMEFVEGEDLRGWLRSAERQWDEVLQLFCRAGEGLAAAHEAGIIHRDFKPDNVLVGSDGRVCVADFGLAHALEAELGGAAQSTPQSAKAAADALPTTPSGSTNTSKRLFDSLTRTGAIMGTPAYMAPEQFRGEPTDARTDQYSFCVALWEGLYGRRPYSGANLAALASAASMGQRAPIEYDLGVPPWVHAALLRGLSPRMEARWPSMVELLAALGNDPHARRRRLLRRVALTLGVSTLLAASSSFGLAQLEFNTRQHYWNGLTEQLLELERERGLAQATNDAVRASDATHMNLSGNYMTQLAGERHEDPTAAVALLREVQGEARTSSAWISAANLALGEGIAEAVLEGHGEAVGPLVFGAKGEWLYSAADDGEVWRWDLARAEGERIISHGRQVNELLLSPDGRWLASAGEDAQVRLWNTETKRAVVLARHAAAVQSMTFSPSGESLASGDSDGGVRVHGLDGREQLALQAGESSAWALAFDAQGEHLAIGSQDHRVRVWSVVEQREQAQLEAHRAPVFHLRWVGPGALVSAADDGELRAWELGDPQAPTSTLLTHHDRAISALDVLDQAVVSASVTGSIHLSSLQEPHTTIELPGHEGAVYSLRFARSGQALLSASFDRSARLTPLDAGGSSASMLGHRQPIYRLALAPDGRRLATGSYDGTVRVWDLERPRLVDPLPGHGATVKAIAVDPRGERFVTTSHDGSARVWAREGALEAELRTDALIRCARFSPDGQQIAMGTNRDLQLFSPSGGEPLHLRGHTRAVFDLAYAPDGRKLASASIDETLRIWDTSSGAELLTLRGHEGRVVAVAFDAAGTRLFSASTDKTLRIWDVEQGSELQVLRGHEGKLTSFARTHDDRLLITGSDDGSLRVWSGRDYTLLHRLEGHQKSVWSLDVDHARGRLLSASLDGELRTWALDTGQLLARSSEHTGEVWDARWLPDGRVVSAGADASIRVWEPSGAAAAIVLTGHGTQVASLALLPGLDLISGALDGGVRRWHLAQLRADPDELLAQLRAATRHCPSAEQRITELGLDPAAAARAEAECRARARRSVPND